MCLCAIALKFPFIGAKRSYTVPAWQCPMHKVRSIKIRFAKVGGEELEFPTQSPDLKPHWTPRPPHLTSVPALTNALTAEKANPHHLTSQPSQKRGSRYNNQGGLKYGCHHQSSTNFQPYSVFWLLIASLCYNIIWLMLLLMMVYNPSQIWVSVDHVLANLVLRCFVNCLLSFLAVWKTAEKLR